MCKNALLGDAMQNPDVEDSNFYSEDLTNLTDLNKNGTLRLEAWHHILLEWIRKEVMTWRKQYGVYVYVYYP